MHYFSLGFHNFFKYFDFLMRIFTKIKERLLKTARNGKDRTCKDLVSRGHATVDAVDRRPV